ncbi:hypothetical protein QR685DRAFT_522381 [Neurospora intermedia]|uniref:Uncharacterized protein n=1 Tax=Neurospora intermedia TaxID=5142 RepID=A0ABR3DIS7_NEUIN
MVCFSSLVSLGPLAYLGSFAFDVGYWMPVDDCDSNQDYGVAPASTLIGPPNHNDAPSSWLFIMMRLKDAVLSSHEFFPRLKY